MSPLNFNHILTQAVDELSESESYKRLFYQHTDGNPLPSAKALCGTIGLVGVIIFPGYFECNGRRRYPDHGGLTTE